jgi:ubiquinone/menaquinone biosynthesis C-methylase UbiE
MNGFVNPEEVLSQLELQKEMIAADFGSGSGGWVIPLAKKLEDGKVCAIDVLEEPLSALKSKAKIEKISNIETIRANIEAKEGSGLKENLLDLVLMTNILFEVENKKAIFDEAKRVLKKNGKILVVDWKPESAVGPKEKRISPEELKKVAKNAGLTLEKDFQAGDYHYGLVFTKP